MKKKTALLLCFIFIAVCTLYAGEFVLSGSDDQSPLETAEPDDDAKATSILEAMTLEEKVGQLFMGCFYEKADYAEIAARYHLGSVLLFGASFQQVSKATLIDSLKEIETKCAIPPLIAVDEEGGTVTRISRNPAFRESPFPSPRELYAEGGLDAILTDTHEKNALLSELGIHLNLAPVCDISRNPADFMYDRSLGQDAKRTAEYAAAVVDACLADGIACSLKHFPGYGNAADTHRGLVFDKRPLRQLEENDFLPFEAGIKAGAPTVLVSHNIVSSIDPDLPASLSPAVHKILREDMAFDGVIITDDLSMKAMSAFLHGADSAVTALLAGNDMLCTGDFQKQYDAVLEAVKSGELPEERIDQSVRRILKLKLQLGLTSPQEDKETEQ